jgi:DNA-binding MarR family transcriptional regulator
MSANSETAALAAELRVTFGQLIRRLRAENTAPLGQVAVLGRLDREGPQSISDLAAKERMRPQSMAQTVRELEDAGLVLRRADPDDKRRAFIELTPAGHAALEANRQSRLDWLSRALTNALSEDERAVLEAAAPLLRRIADI